MDSLLRTCFVHREYTSISVDGTYRCMFSLLGQASHRAPKFIRSAQALPEQDAKRVLFTIRGRTGGVLGLFPIASEHSSCISSCLAEHIPLEYRQQVLHVASDDPSSRMFEALREQLPNLQVLSLDPLHLVFTYEQAHWKKRTPGSVFLRKVLARLVGRFSPTDALQHHYFDGSSLIASSRPEKQSLQCLYDLLDRGTLRLA